MQRVSVNCYAKRIIKETRVRYSITIQQGMWQGRLSTLLRYAMIKPRLGGKHWGQRAIMSDMSFL